MSWTLCIFVLLCLGCGIVKRVPLYDAFLEGAKEGVETARYILPALVAMICAIRAFSACGLMELAAVTGKDDCRAAALRLVDGLMDHCCDWSDAHLGLLTHCTASYHDDGAGRHTNITYGDYFFIEALAKMNRCDPMLWL